MNEWRPLTAAQRAIWLGHHLDPDTATFNTAELVRLRDGTSAAELARALNDLVAETPMLGMEFRDGPKGPECRPGHGAPVLVEAVDLRDRADPAGAARQWARDAVTRRTEPTSPLRSALLRVSDTEAWWFQLTHHLCADGYGFALLARRVEQLLVAARTGSAAPASLERSDGLSAVLEADLRYAAGPDRGVDQRHWAAVLAGTHDDGTGAALGTGRQPATNAPPHRAAGALPDTVVATVEAASRACGAGWAEVLLAAVAGYLLRWSGASHYRIAVPMLNRSGPAATTICTTTNLTPLVVHGDTPADVLRTVRDQLPGMRRHARYPAEDLARDAARAGITPLFGAQVNVVPFEREIRWGGTTAEVENVVAGPVDELTVCLRGIVGKGPVMLELDGRPGLCRRQDVVAHAARLTAWIGAFAAALIDDRPFPALATDADRSAIARFNRTERPRRPVTLPESLAVHAARSPGTTALVDAGTGGSWTFGELDNRVALLAGRLRNLGIGRGDVVAVALPRSPHLVVAVHAVQRAGGAYLPVDSDLPPARLAGVLADAAATAVVVDPVTAALLRVAAPGVPMLDIAGSRTTFPLTGTGPATVDDPAYVIFTSGSTGRPKGVLIGHAAIDNRLAWMQHHFRLGAGDRALLKTPETFDVSVWELFWPLRVGVPLVVAPPQAHRDPRWLAEIIRENQVTLVHFVPSMLRELLADPASVATIGDGLRAVVCSGEALPAELADAAARAFGARVTNLYGPTEAAVDVTVHDHDPAAGLSVVPIGRPIWNTRCAVLDAHRHPVPVGAVGELWLGGVQLADGYVGRPDLTAERFRTDLPDQPGAPAGSRWYATGDLARWWPGGSLEYLGRTDSQRKIHGRRVELAEIEAVIGDVDGVSAVAVDLRPPARLVAFLARGGVPDRDGELVRAARDRAEALLPSWMRPADYVPVPALPLSSSGKLDRLAVSALPTVAAPFVTDRVVTGGVVTGGVVEGREAGPDGGVDPDGGGDSPDGPLVEQLCRAFADVLVGEDGQLPVVRPHDDFFDLGGTSLTALRLMSRVEAAFGRRPSLTAIFRWSTPAGLAHEFADHADDDLGVLLGLRPRGDQRPLFCVHPAGGLAWCYAGLLPHLPPSLPVYGLQARGLHGGERLPATLAEMAGDYLARIRSVQPHGPYRLLGWSVGGMVVHEIASQIQATGGSVELVAMLDAYPSQQWRSLPEPDEAEALRALLRIGGADHADGTVPAGPPTRRQVKAALTEHGSALAGLPDRTLDAVIDIVRNNARLVRRSDHGIVDGDVVFVAARHDGLETGLDPETWRPHLTGRLVRHDLPVSHRELISPAPLATVGGIVTRWLAHEGADPGQTSLTGTSPSTATAAR